MRSISPWQLPRCPSLQWEPTPRREGLVHFRARHSVVGRSAPIISVPANSTKHVYPALTLLMLTPLLLVLVIAFFIADASLEAQAPPAPIAQPSAYGQADRVSQLITQLKDPDFRVRENAAQALGESKDARAVEPLIAALKNYKDPASRVRENAARALGKIKDPRAVEPLIAALGDSAYGPREMAAKALGEIKDPRAVEPLIAFLKASLKATHFNQADAGLAEEAERALGEIKDPRAVEPLIAVLKNPKDPGGSQGSVDSWVFRGAVQGLYKIGPPAVEPLIAALKNPNYSAARKYVARVLGVFASDRNNAGPDLADSPVDMVDGMPKVWAPLARSVLLEAVTKRDTAVIAGAYFFFLEKGQPDVDDLLVAALLTHGDHDMAQYFVFTGDPKLLDAAIKWKVKTNSCLFLPTSRPGVYFGCG